MFIQEEPDYVDQLAADGYGFFGVVDEDGYLEETAREYLLCYGALYLYECDDSVVAGFWQH